MASPATTSNNLPALAPKATEKSEKPATEANRSVSRAKEKDDDGMGIEELAMPRTMIQRLARSALPPNTQLQKDTILALTKSATLFINHIAAFALEDLGPNKKTIMPANVFAAIEETEFAFMIPTLKAELEKFVAIQANKKEEYKKKMKDGKPGPDGSTMLVGDEDSIADGSVQTRGADPAAQLEAESAIDRERTAKRAKGAGGAVVTAAEEEDEDVDMIGPDAQDDAAEEEELDEEATESENDSEDEVPQEDGVGTEPEDEGEDDDARTEDDSD